MGLFEKMTERACANPQRIVLAEGTEPRTLTAANRIIGDKIADIILIGEPEAIAIMAKEMNLPNISRATIIDPSDEKVINRYAPLLFELRKKKGMTVEQSRLTLPSHLQRQPATSPAYVPKWPCCRSRPKAAPNTSVSTR